MSAGPDTTVVGDLLAFLDASPTPYHAAAEAARRLADAGSSALALTGDWASAPARGHTLADGALIAWSLPESPAAPPLRLIGAHTDSPGLRVKPDPDTASAGWRQLGVEVYGGALVNSWLDRDLGLAGRAAILDGDTVTTRLFRADGPLLRIAQLAIHLDREITTQGLRLDRQRHLTPVWGVGAADVDGFRRFVAEAIDTPPDRVRGWDVLVHDPAPASLLGVDDSFVSSGRLDDLCSCWAAVRALEAFDPGSTPSPGGAMIALFDHEEVGSATTRGAAGPLLGTVLERLLDARGATRDEFHAGLAASALASADMAHATHPNYPERHEPDHPIAIDGGPVIKINANQRYATEAATQAAFEAACDRARVPVQHFVSHNEMACGSTIGPLAATRLGIPTVDVGVAQLAMHSARELCGALDAGRMVAALGEWLRG